MAKEKTTDLTVYGTEKSTLLETAKPYVVSKQLADTLVKKGAASLKPVKAKEK